MKIFNTLILLSLFLISCSKKPLYNDPLPSHDSFTLESSFVGEERVINVWTPKVYTESKTPLPVMYMADGGIKEDFPHMANTFSKLIMSKSIPPFILVGIENTDRRRDLSGPSEVVEDEKYCPLTDGAKNFRAFITEELITEIDSKYRTSDIRGILGESLSGLFVMETLLLEPDAFEYYIAMDPSLWWNDHYLVKNAITLLSTNKEKKSKLWFAGSDAKDISKYTLELENILEKNLSNSLIWKYSNEPKEQHNTIFRATKEKALIWTLNEN